MKAEFGSDLFSRGFFYMKSGNNPVKKAHCNVHVNKFVWDGCITRHKKNSNVIHNVLNLNLLHVVHKKKNLRSLVFKCYVQQKTKSSCGKRKWAYYFANLPLRRLQRELIGVYRDCSSMLSVSDWIRWSRLSTVFL